MSELRSLRRLLWNMQRLMGWGIAAAAGPKPLAKRVGRAFVFRSIARWMR